MSSYPLPSEKKKGLSKEFTETVEAFRNWLLTLGYSKSSVLNLPNHTESFFFHLKKIGVGEVERIERSHAKQFMQQLSQRANRRNGSPLSPAYLNKHLQALKLLSQYLRKTGKGTFTLEGQGIQTEQQIKEVLTTEEIKDLFESTGNDSLGLRDKAMLSVFYGCGLRRNEGASLLVKDVLFREKLLHVRKGKGKKERYVPMSEQVIRSLKEYLHHGRNGFLNSEKLEGLFISKAGNHISDQALALSLKRLAKKAELQKPVTLHLLRHSIATHLLQNGMPLQQVAEFLGHASLDSTQIYTRVAHGL